MRIVWLAPIPLIDNTDTHPAPWVISLAQALIGNNNDLTIINYNSKIDKDILEIEYNKIKIIYIKTPNLKLDFITLYKNRIHKVKSYLQLIIGEFDILHIHGTEHQYEAMSKGLNIPKVISIQGIMSEYIKFVPKKNYKRYLEWKLSAIYESKFLTQNHNYSCRTHWDSNYIKNKNQKAKIYMIWEMIREDFFSDYFSLKKDNILFVGGINPLKGLNELLAAYNSSIQNLGLNLIILGNCSLEDIKDIIFKKKLKNIDLNNIDCRGMQKTEGMINAYKDSYCLIHPTFIDNSPNSICEAQIAGLPVIATDVGGVSSLIKHKESGFLIGRKSIDIENAISELYINDSLRNHISTTSRIIARRRHNKETITMKTIDMYDDVIKNYKETFKN